ncbi:UDP-glucose 4-epimerase [Leptidea sinapis]|uniref:UDP-glucose 4-epimerase n=1 Tax=Leptidea sinapis TaxID=189913 RepID=UPI002120FBC8|nr:UDP-glucose 4-epimerase [Leptidea sinapis]XP_050668197.1 UDP-glucose 4-epimerase [Leptidea sinapis]XP_050668198.1 UDP-glucose 4-epimerase [Leptidea sinapis]
MPPSILVTGGAGYVGSHTVATLLERDDNRYDIVVVDNLSNSYRSENEKKPEALRRIEDMTGSTIHFYANDIRDRAALNRIFENHEIECVIHFAALKAVGESVEKPLEYYQANITGTCTLLEVMREHGVTQLVYSSSCTVYGEPQKLPLDEGHPTGQGISSPYGRTKYFCEEIMKDLCASDQNWKVISLRYFNPVGAHGSGRIGEDPYGIPNNLMPFISQVAVGRLSELLVFGGDYPTADGSGVRDYIHVQDLADGHVRAIQLFQDPRFVGFQPINLGTGTGYSVLQMVAAFEAASGCKIPHRVVGRRAGDIATNYADVSLARQLLGWGASRTVIDMCRDTWKWQSENPNGYKN